MRDSFLVAWLLYGDRSVASSRLQGYHIHDRMTGRLDSRLAFAPPTALLDVPWGPRERGWLCRAARGGVVVLQKIRGERTEQLVRDLSHEGVATVYVQCDLEPENLLPTLCNVVVCPSRQMSDHLTAMGCQRVEFIPDPIETSWAVPAPVRPARRGLRLCWVGHRTNWEGLAEIREILREEEFADIELVTISNHPDADIPWSMEAVHEVLPGCDLGVVPVGVGAAFQVKSSNRILLFMAAGLPVVAGRLRSYEEVIEHGRNGFLAQSADEYRAAFRSLRDPAIRAIISRAAFDESRRDFGIDRIADRWAALIESIRPAKSAPSAIERDRILKRLDAATHLGNASILLRRDLIAEARAEFKIGLRSFLRNPHPSLLATIMSLRREFASLRKQEPVISSLLSGCRRLVPGSIRRVIRRAVRRRGGNATHQIPPEMIALL